MRIVPYRTALVPDAPVAVIPHKDASAPGSDQNYISGFPISSKFFSELLNIN